MSEPQPSIHGLQQELATAFKFDYEYEYEIGYECDFSNLGCVA